VTEHTFHVELPRDLTDYVRTPQEVAEGKAPSEREIMEHALAAAWETIAKRADRWALLAPHAHHLTRRVPNLHDAHADDDGHEEPLVDSKNGLPRKRKPHDDLIGKPVFDIEDDESRAQLYCGDCGRARQGDHTGILICPSVADHPGRAVACHPPCAVDCGVIRG
jgi:hypothetical protein